MALPTLLTEDIERAGFFPELVTATLTEALGHQEVTSHLIHINTHFDYDDVQRHMTVLTLTHQAVVAVHVHDYVADEAGRDVRAQVSQEIIALKTIDTVTVTAVYADPQHYTPDSAIAEVLLRVIWAGSTRLTLVPADCPDPDCIADHGMTGDATPEDLLLRISAEADGQKATDEAMSFARALRDAVFAHHV